MDNDNNEKIENEKAENEIKNELEQELENAAETAEETAEETKEINNDEEVVDVPKEDSLEQKLEKSEQALKETYDKYLRQVAEFDNYRKRTTAEKSAMYSNGVRDTVEKLLPVIDNFERAVNMAEDKESSIYKGTEMILKQFLEILNSLGVSEIEAEGQPFDPNIHFAVAHIEDENCDDNVVVEVLQKGYKLGDKIIRPSMVKVAN